MTDSILHAFTGSQLFDGITIAPHTKNFNFGSSASLNGAGVEGEPQSFSSVLENVAQLLPKARTFLHGLETQEQGDQLFSPYIGHASNSVLRKSFVDLLAQLENGIPGNGEGKAVTIDGSEASPSSDLFPTHILREALLALNNHPTSSTLLSDIHEDLNRLSQNNALRETAPAITNLQSDPLVSSNVHEDLTVHSQSNAYINRLLQSILGSLDADRPHINSSPIPGATSPTLSPITQIGSSPVPQKHDVILPPRIITEPLTEPTLSLVKGQQNISDAASDAGTKAQSFQRLGLNHESTSEKLVRDTNLSLTHQNAIQDSKRETLVRAPGVVDPAVVRNSNSALITNIQTAASGVQPELRLLEPHGFSNPAIGENVQGRIHVESGVRSAITTSGSPQSATGELGSSGGETLLGQHTNSGLASSSDSQHGNSSPMNQAQSAVRASAFEERFQSYQATLPQRLQIDVQLSENSRVQVDVAVQQRQVYAALLMDQPILRNLALQHAPQLEGQLHQIGMELQDLDVEVEHQSQAQNEPFEHNAQGPRPIGKMDQDVNDSGNAGKDVESGREQGVHVVV